MENKYGPRTAFAEETHRRKYRLNGESFRELCNRNAQALADNPEHFYRLRDIFLNQLFMGAGRIQSSVGSPQRTTAFNCFVSGTIEDSMDGIMDRAKEAAQTMRLGGGIGYDFSTLRPRDAVITTLGSRASGAVSFMEIFNSVCATVSSAGDRRGAQMGVLRVDHPDIEEFVDKKTNLEHLTNFNISVAVTDEFMEAVEEDEMFALKFDGRTYKQVSAVALWEKIMRATWDWAEPGVLFIDRINAMNNLWYCEDIAATNPCGEQPLPPYGACLLGSYNATKLVTKDFLIDYEMIDNTIEDVVRGLDNVIDVTTYPLEQHKIEATSKRRMGIGVTGLANACEAYAHLYGSPEFIDLADNILSSITHGAYRASIKLAREKGPFPAFDRDKYLQSQFIKTLPEDIQDGIYSYGIRNSHLISFAPAGTISITADNISSGIEPVFSLGYSRTVSVDGIEKQERVEDYGKKFFGVEGRTSDACSIDHHLSVLSLATKYSDSAVSKTINVGSSVGWDEFKDIYMKAWKMGAKGCTTFRADGKRFGVLNEDPTEGSACYIDEETGQKSCS
jgi:ribonucleoside-diphosphate reductase alpha chain